MQVRGLPGGGGGGEGGAEKLSLDYTHPSAGKSSRHLSDRVCSGTPSTLFCQYCTERERERERERDVSTTKYTPTPTSYTVPPWLDTEHLMNRLQLHSKISYWVLSPAHFSKVVFQKSNIEAHCSYTPHSLILSQEDIVAFLVAGIVKEQHHEGMLGIGGGDGVGGLGDGILLPKLGEGDAWVEVQPLHFHHCTRCVVLHTVDVIALWTTGRIKQYA